MSQTVCCFCGRSGERAKEHVIPLWLQERLEVRRALMRATHLTFVGNQLSQREHVAQRLELGDVCAACNNGWMSRLESAVKPVFERLLANRPPDWTLSAEERRSLSVWAWKTAMVLNRASNYRKIVPESHFTFLFERKAIASNVRIDLGCSTESRSIRWVQSQQWAIFTHEPEKAYLEGMHSYRVTLELEGILLCVAFWPGDALQLERHTENSYRPLHPPIEEASAIGVKPSEIHDFDLDLFVRSRTVCDSGSDR